MSLLLVAVILTKESLQCVIISPFYRRGPQSSKESNGISLSQFSPEGGMDSWETQ